MSSERTGLTWGQAAMVEMFHRRGLDPVEWPLCVVFDEQEGHTDRDSVLAALTGLVARHDVLTALFDDAADTLDLADPRTFPQQVVRRPSDVRPLTIDMDWSEARLTREQLMALTHSEFVRRRRAFMPVLINRGGKWMAGALVSHIAVDGRGVEQLRDEYRVLLDGKTPRLRAAKITDVLEVESSPDHTQAEKENLTIVQRLLSGAADANLRKDPSTDPATFGVVESAGHARTLAELSTRLRVTKPGISLIVYAIVLSVELAARDVVVRSQFRRQSPVQDATSVVANTPFAFSSVSIDMGMSFRALVQREFGAIVEGYRASVFSPYGYERVKHVVARERGMEELDGIPEFNYLPRADRPRTRAARVAAGTVERSWVEIVDNVQPYSRGNLSIFEEDDHDALQLFGTRWRESTDSFEVVRTFNRFCAVAATDVDRRVGEIFERAKSAYRTHPIAPFFLEHK
ncbi:hypothetical protein [Streptomyces sp. NPDC046862]|uniref:hypothetical protein n=1 Tax=Streptomyces sp. NPDC046862 TaxID=3154603 RepID=UPI0034523B0F